MNMKRKNLRLNSQGFTLIELLIVIAIIGILASVVMSSVNTARTKATDAAIKANLANVRGMASLWYDDNAQVYASAGNELSPKDVCPAVIATGNIFSDTKLFGAVNQAYLKSGDNTKSQCVATATTWAVAIELKTADGTGANKDSWCVDSLGASRAYQYTGVQTIADAINADTCS